MSSYNGPRWYDQEPEQQHSNSPSPENPVFDDFPSLPSSQEADDRASPRHEKPAQEPPFETNQRVRRMLRQILLIAGLLVIAFLGGWFSHQAYANSFSPNDQSRYYSNLFQQAWNTVDQNYVDRKAINYKQMSYQAIQAMLAVLNDKGHTRFLTPTDVQAFNQQVSGKYIGVGLNLRQDPTTKQVIIVSTIPGSPAEKAGFKRGDIIVAVNGTNVVGKGLDSIHTLNQGPTGTVVSFTVQRPSTGQTLTIKVTRQEIQVPNVIMHYIPEDHIAHIQILGFDDGVSAQLQDAITQAKKQGARKIILDLRDDPGGYLNEAVKTASEFMKNGNVLLEQDSSGQRTPIGVSGDPVDTTDTIVVLVNTGTASAAEIVSGAMQDNHRAIIIGTKTYGTGTVLQQFPLADGSAILLGVQEWLTPNGNFIRDRGITPDITVTLATNSNLLTPSDENAGNLTERQILSSGDTQLVTAIHYLETH